MKTLTQILLENEFQYGLNLKDNINVQKLERLTDTREFKFLNDVKPVNIFEFTMTKTPKVKINGEDMDPGNPVHVVKTFQDTVKNSNMKINSNTDLLVINKTTNKRIWYFIEVSKNKNINIEKTYQIPMSVILDKFQSSYTIIKDYEGNSYYWLSGVPEVLEKSVTAAKTQKQTAKATEKNRQKWNNWIPHYDYENGNRNYDIDKIRKLIGLTGKNDTFDDNLEKYLKAWQKQFRIPDTGKWDNASQEKALDILQDRPYENLNTEIETYSALKKPIAKDTPSTSLNDLVALAKNYRQWANTTSDLKKKYGSKSDYELNSTYVKPANDYFKKSYAAGREEFEAAGGMTKTFTALKPVAPIVIPKKEDGQTDPSLIN